MKAKAIQKTSMESWIAGKIGASGQLTREDIEQYQLQKLRECIVYASQHSPFYRKLLQGIAESELTSLVDLRRLPFTTSGNLREHGLQFLCVSQDEISRVVTLSSSGTTGRAKRVFFSVEDQQLMLDFVEHGVCTLADPGDKVLILIPGELPGSVGDLLARGISRMGAITIPHGVVRDLRATLNLIADQRVDTVIGIPVQVLALARYAEQVAQQSLHLKNIVLIADHAPASIVRELDRVCGCRPFDHYGMTEMGLGGGLDCSAHVGYHLREADLYFEIVDAVTGEPLPDGDIGEIVFTTLTRKGMPLIRYRTGDISRFLPEPCPCGTVLRRLDYIQTRKNTGITIAEGSCELTISKLDEVLFPIAGLIDFTAAVGYGQYSKSLMITARSFRPQVETERAVRTALDTLPDLCIAQQSGLLDIAVHCVRADEQLSYGTGKRAITVLGEVRGEQDDLSDTAWQDHTGR
jgi:phenylacetate-coenzyme A ligase PaaK-like adenylate-forming protein